MINKYVLFLCLGLCACTPPILEPFRIETYTQDTVQLAVRDIQIINQTQDFTTLPHIESKLPITPVTALKTALSNHFTPAKIGNNQITFTITEASFIQKKAEDERWYILDNVEYLLSYRLVVSLTQDSHTQTQEIVGWEKQNIPERSNIAEKEKVWEMMLNNMTAKVIQKIETDFITLHS